MRPVVLVGHRHECPKHGTGTVVSGTAGVNVNGREVACIGHAISCGATITSGSSTVTLKGKGVARIGDSSSHGGTLVEGEGAWLID